MGTNGLETNLKSVTFWHYLILPFCVTIHHNLFCCLFEIVSKSILIYISDIGLYGLSDSQLSRSYPGKRMTSLCL
jgi:hypothetical protein